MPAITSSTACTAPPTARKAASKLPGDMVVSASSRDQAFLRRRVADGGDVVHGMAERDGLERSARRLDARERLEALVLERAVDGAQPVRPLGMAGRREVVEAGGVGDEEGGSSAYPNDRGACAALKPTSGD